jgi:transketolase
MPKDVEVGLLTRAANVVRGLVMDGVQKAKSGHPGMPMGMADIATTLFLRHLRHHPAHLDWIDRDRLVLSGGHGSMLLYSLLHLSGYDLPMSELQSFRQWESRTPGHPEFGLTPGVETTTGPLGQGCANAVGMALAERMLAVRFNTREYSPIDHHTFVFCGDGDMMEGISHEAFALAGHLRLNKLIVFYDDNKITIEGSTNLAYSDDVEKRFEGYGWNVLRMDAHRIRWIGGFIRKARRELARPTLIICRSHIGHGSPNKADTAAAHGEPLGEDEVKAAKRNLGLPEDQSFYVPDSVREDFRCRGVKLRKYYQRWERLYESYAKTYPDKARELEQFTSGHLPENLDWFVPKFDPATPLATRVASGKVIQNMAKVVPNLIGGAADLAPSTRTLIEGEASISTGVFRGRNLHFGVREHGMAGIMNGIALHGGYRVFGATFFVFADYCRPSIRLAALMKLPVIYVFTHDSFYVGEDGPTHEPVEQLASLRAIPGMTVIRPADATETASAWVVALRNPGPTALLFTRHNVPTLDRALYPPAALLAKGAYSLWQSGQGVPDVVLIGSGSEVCLALEAAKALASRWNVRVVSMPSWELFERQPAAYRDEVLPPACTKRLAIEAGVPMGWERYVGSSDRVVGMRRFGASAPYKVLGEKFGFTVANVLRVAQAMLEDSPAAVPPSAAT